MTTSREKAANGPATALSGTLAGAGPGPGGAVTRVRLDVSYDGSGFHGWSRQPRLRSVQETLEDALGSALSLPAGPALTVAGRTDAGVHARGQVAHADLPSAAWDAASPTAARRLARLLPPDLRVRAAVRAPAGFDARFSALWRRYSYRVCDDPAAADPLRRRDTLWYPRQVDIERMNEAARACLGEHDFAAFCRRREGASTVRELLRLEWERHGPGIAVAAVTADAFCHNMVRALVGGLLSVGDGRRPVGWLAEVLAAGVRNPAVVVAAPHGLCLEEVRYPPDRELAARAQATRRLRHSLPPAPATAPRESAAAVPRSPTIGFVPEDTTSGPPPHRERAAPAGASPAIRGVIIDWGGVMTNPILETVDAWIGADQIDRESYIEVMRSWVAQAYGDGVGDNPIHALERGECSNEEFERLLADELRHADGRPVRAEGLLARMFAATALETVMLDLVRQLRQAGLRTALLSNSWGNADYPRHLFPDLFDVVVISSEVGMRKPEERIFRHAASLLGLDPRECVFIDDVEANVAAAKAVGLVGLHHRQPAPTIASLTNLLGLPLT